MKSLIMNLSHIFNKNLRQKLLVMAILPLILIQIGVGLVAFFAYSQVIADLMSSRDRELARLSAEQLSSYISSEVEHLNRQTGVFNLMNQLNPNQTFQPTPMISDTLGTAPGTLTGTPPGISTPRNNTTTPRPNDDRPPQDEDGIILTLNTDGIVNQVRPATPETNVYLGQDWSDNPYFQQAVTTLEPAYSDMLTDNVNNKDMLIIAAPISTSGTLHGIAVNLLYPADLEDGGFYKHMENELIFSAEGNTYLVDSYGIVIYHSNPAYIGQDFSDQDAVEDVLDGEQDAVFTENIAGQPTIASYAQVPGTPWSLVIEDNWSGITDALSIYQIVLVILLLGGVCIPTVVIAIGVNRVISPIEKLTRATQEVARGDFDQTICVHTGDEIETLATQFNQMSAQLRESYSTLEQRVVERTAQLQAANERYRVVSNLTSDYVYHITITPYGDFALDWATEAFSRFTGYPPAELAAVGGWTAIIHSEDLPHYQAQREALLAALAKDDQPVPTAFEYRIIARNGEIRWLRDYWQPIKETDPHTTLAILGAAQDISERKLAEEALREATISAQRSAEAAQAANRAKSVFLANMSHELRTPLNAILGYSQLMVRDPQVTATQREQLETIGRSGEHLLGLINDVLTMSKIEAGRAVLQENAFDLHRQLEGLREIFLMQARNKGLTMILDIAPEIPHYVYADEGKLRQILMNLLSNAVKFTQEGGVTLRTGFKRRDPAPDAPKAEPTLWLRFEVEDTGPGISPEEMKILFEPFIQTATGQKSKEGTGLGLPISQQFVHLMGGKLEVDSTMGKGSCFRLEIPIRLAEADEIETYVTHPHRRVTGIEPGPSYRILIVEDQATNRDLLQRLLNEFGFEIQCAVNGQEGLSLWEFWQPHLIWMDMRMPVMDGYEATRRIKERARTLGKSPIIIALTASAFEEDRTAILEAGCDDFVRKPFRESDIFEALTQHLGVRFTYADPEKTEAAIPSSSVEIPPEILAAELAGLPAQWKNDLYRAAQELDNEKMLQLVAQARSEAPQLAGAIAHWIKDFEYEKILQTAASAVGS